MEETLRILIILTWIVSIFAVYAIGRVFYEEYKLKKKIRNIKHDFKIGEEVLYKGASFEIVKVYKYILTIKHGIELNVYKDEVQYLEDKI